MEKNEIKKGRKEKDMKTARQTQRKKDRKKNEQKICERRKKIEV